MELDSQKVVDRVVGGTLLVALKPFVLALGFLLKRNHKLEPREDGHIVVMKMLGGGSLVIALPALLGLRRRYPRARLTLVTTTAIAPFARSLGVFDELVVIDSKSPLKLVFSSLAALARTFRADTFLDLEVYSKLTTVFSLLTCARNRLGFYLESVVWRKPIQTHLIFFNRSAPVHLFYERMAALLGAEPASFEDCQAHVLKTLGAARDAGSRRVAIGTGCSRLSRERMFTAEEWLGVFHARIQKDPTLLSAEFVFVGGVEDAPLVDKLRVELNRHWPSLRSENLCGKLKLGESLARLAACAEFWGIDSALLHYARLFGLFTVSYWGPTSPDALLKPCPIREEVHYRRIPCSPCVHVAEFAPCNGRNLCMKSHLREIHDDELRRRLPVITNNPMPAEKS